MISLSPIHILIAFAMGVLPALLWLWFWLHEDSIHPEPRRVLIITFILGMIATLPALWAESSMCTTIQNNQSSISGFVSNLPFFAQSNLRIDCFKGSLVGGLALFIIIIWVIIEELAKLGIVYIAALWRKDNNEPIDALIYLITGALGFAAAENTLYLLSSLNSAGSAIQGVVLGNFRFLGATLVHTVSSGAIGLALAFSYFKPRWTRGISIIIGFLIAVVLHTTFNLFILNSDEGNFLITFGCVWLASIILLLFFEKVKEIHQKYYSTEPITETL